MLKEWSENPHDMKDGKVGYPLELLYKELLTRMFPDQLVSLSPSALDKRSLNSVPPADIVIGEQIKRDLVSPLLLISSKLSNGNKSQVNLLFNTPEITLNAQKIWGKKNTFKILEEFADTTETDKFLYDLLDKYEWRIRQRILNGITNIDENFIRTGTDRKVTNITVYKKIIYIRELLEATSNI